MARKVALKVTAIDRVTWVGRWVRARVSLSSDSSILRTICIEQRFEPSVAKLP